MCPKSLSNWVARSAEQNHPNFFSTLAQNDSIRGFPFRQSPLNQNDAFPGLKKQPLATHVEPWTWQPCFKTNSFLLVNGVNRVTSLNTNENFFALTQKLESHVLYVNNCTSAVKFHNIKGALHL